MYLLKITAKRVLEIGHYIFGFGIKIFAQVQIYFLLLKFIFEVKRSLSNKVVAI